MDVNKRWKQEPGFMNNGSNIWPDASSAKPLAEIAVPAGKKLVSVRAQVEMKD